MTRSEMDAAWADHDRANSASDTTDHPDVFPRPRAKFWRWWTDDSSRPLVQIRAPRCRPLFVEMSDARGLADAIHDLCDKHEAQQREASR